MMCDRKFLEAIGMVCTKNECTAETKGFRIDWLLLKLYSSDIHLIAYLKKDEHVNVNA
jgi:hypothetical protein